MPKLFETGYTGFITEIKQSIIRSRYQAARLANREQLLLYLFVGKRLSENIKAKKWGAKVLHQISIDLQHELPGLRGFSVSNLKNMRQFAEEYAHLLIGQSATAQLKKGIRQSATAQMKMIGKSKGFTENQLTVFSALVLHTIYCCLQNAKAWRRGFFMWKKLPEEMKGILPDAEKLKKLI